MARKVPGDLIDLVGPLGGHVFDANPTAPVRHVMVGGGYGVPPLIFLGQTILQANPSADVHFIFGARSKSLLLCLDDPPAMGATLDACTDDGSFGTRGRVTEALIPLINSGKSLSIYTCGPTPMMRAVAEMSVAANIDCQVSLEVPMPCGVGVCMGCVIDTANQSRVRACTEGPVFKAVDVVW
jgi:dihydroorotate dehydrogenase electron transfer subunit